MLHNLIVHSPILGPWIPLPQPLHVLLRLRCVDLKARDPLPNSQLHRAHDLRAPCGEIIVAFFGGRLLGRRGRAAILPFEPVGVVTGWGVRTVLAVTGIAKCDDELVAFIEIFGQAAYFAALDCGETRQLV